MIVRWEPVMAHCGSYFVEYTPASPGNYLAMLVLVYVGETPDSGTITAHIEKEFDAWIRKFPVPLMASAVDSSGSNIHLRGEEDARFLTGYRDGDRIVSKWGLYKDSEIPEHLKKLEHRIKVYENLEAVTKQEVQAGQAERRKIVRMGWFLVLVGQ